MMKKIVEKTLSALKLLLSLQNYYYSDKPLPAMNKDGFWSRAFHLYYDGFRSMTLGKTLWAVILVKLVIIFVVLKMFFFPDFLGTHAPEGGEADFVAAELGERFAE